MYLGFTSFAKDTMQVVADGLVKYQPCLPGIICLHSFI